jgi:hypothetical protein
MEISALAGKPAPRNMLVMCLLNNGDASSFEFPS